MPILTCENVTMAYDKAVAVQDVNFTLSAGDYVCIVGENGAGKSTLIKGILGLQKPLSGNITFSGLHSNEIGYMPQQTVVQQDFPASVQEVVLSGCLAGSGLLPFYTRPQRARAEEMLKLLAIEGLAKKSYRELSGGQQQRVLLARALCATKKLLLLDEPVAGLDPIVSAELYAVISRLNKQSGIAVLMISHDVASAMQHASHILHLQKSTVFFGTTQDYQHSGPGRRMLGGEVHV